MANVTCHGGIGPYCVGAASAPHGLLSSAAHLLVSSVGRCPLGGITGQRGPPYEPWKAIAASALLHEAVYPDLPTLQHFGGGLEKQWLHRVVLVLEEGGSLRPRRGTLVSSYARTLLYSTKYSVQVVNQVRKDARGRVWFTFVGAGRLVSSQRVVPASPDNVFHRSFVDMLRRTMALVYHTMDVVEETQQTLSPIYKAGMAWVGQADASHGGGETDEAAEECYDVFAYRAYKMRRVSAN